VSARDLRPRMSARSSVSLRTGVDMAPDSLSCVLEVYIILRENGVMKGRLARFMAASSSSMITRLSRMKAPN
jgi:hypothetical protein